MADQDLKGKVIVITGASSGIGKGASSGIGKGAALEFARLGAHVALAARRDQVLEELAKECETAGGRAIAVQTDVTRQDEVAQLAQTTVSTFGRIDVWINNAGSGAVGLFEEVPIAEHVRVIETDLLGTIYGSHAAMNQFKVQGTGILINVASVIGKIPAPYFASYAAAKHGVVGLSAALRQELDVNKVSEIHVCTVMPMSMDTPFFEHAASHTGHEVVPIPPVYEPEQVIDALVRLASDPKDEVTVGGANGPGMVLTHQLAPGLIEHMMAKLTHKMELQKAAAALETTGSVMQPSPSGAGVAGGWKE